MSGRDRVRLQEMPGVHHVPLKGVIVEYNMPDKTQTMQAADPAQGGAQRDG